MMMIPYGKWVSHEAILLNCFYQNLELTVGNIFLQFALLQSGTRYLTKLFQLIHYHCL